MSITIDWNDVIDNDCSKALTTSCGAETCSDCRYFDHHIHGVLITCDVVCLIGVTDEPILEYIHENLNELAYDNEVDMYDLKQHIKGEHERSTEIR